MRRRVKVFIRGKNGTTGIKTEECLNMLKDISLITLKEEFRKDLNARKDAINSSDATVLCLPDDAAIQAVSLVENENTLKMRVYERGNGETYACGSGACAAVVAATETGLIKKNRDVTVKVKGGDLTVNYSDDCITLSGDTVLVYKGEFEF